MTCLDMLYTSKRSRKLTNMIPCKAQYIKACILLSLFHMEFILYLNKEVLIKWGLAYWKHIFSGSNIPRCVALAAITWRQMIRQALPSDRRQRIQLVFIWLLNSRGTAALILRQARFMLRGTTIRCPLLIIRAIRLMKKSSSYSTCHILVLKNVQYTAKQIHGSSDAYAQILEKRKKIM